MNFENEPIHTHVHIEKTGGTSLQDVFGQIYGAKNVLVYDARSGLFIRLSDKGITAANNSLLNKMKLALGESPILPFAYRIYMILSERRRNSAQHFSVENLPSDTRAVTGHFPADILDEYYPDQFQTIVLRDPLERIISQFIHWRRHRGTVGWRNNLPYDPTITFEDYALLTIHHNYQSKIFAGKSLTDFNVFGVTEQLDAFCQKTFANSSYSLKSLNIAPTHYQLDTLDVMPDFIDEFKKVNREDYEIYQFVRSQFELETIQ